MFLSIVGAVIFLWLLYKVYQRIIFKLQDPFGKALRIADKAERERQRKSI
jgi:hypothetical protein